MNHLNTLRVCFYISVTLLSANLSAQSQSQLDLQNSRSAVSGLIVGTVYSNPQKGSSAESVNGSELTGTFRVVNKSGYMFGLSAGIDKQLEGERKESIRDSFLSVFKNFKIFDNVATSARTAVTIPLSDNSRERQGLITSIRPSLRIDYSPFKKVFLTATPNARLNFHEYQVATTGISNTQYSFGSGLELAYSLTPKLIASVSGSYARNFTYEAISRDAYQLSQSLTYFINGTTIASLGHSLGGVPLAPNGTDTDIKIYDSRDSIYFLSLILVL